MAMVHWAQVNPFEGMKRIDGAPSYVTEKGFTLVNCTHFGGDSSVVWGLSVVLGSHNNTSTGNAREIEACGGDMYVWRRHQEGLCLMNRRIIFNGALLRSLPRLLHSTPERSFTIQVLYWRGYRPPIAGVKEEFRKRIVEMGGNECRDGSTELVMKCFDICIHLYRFLVIPKDFQLSCLFIETGNCSRIEFTHNGL